MVVIEAPVLYKKPRCSTIMELGPQNQSKDGLFGPSYILTVSHSSVAQGRFEVYYAVDPHSAFWISGRRHDGLDFRELGIG